MIHRKDCKRNWKWMSELCYGSEIGIQCAGLLYCSTLMKNCMLWASLRIVNIESFSLTSYSKRGYVWFCIQFFFFWFLMKEQTQYGRPSTHTNFQYFGETSVEQIIKIILFLFFQFLNVKSRIGTLQFAKYLWTICSQSSPSFRPKIKD